jgi:Resolvase, N terminal domain
MNLKPIATELCEQTIPLARFCPCDQCGEPISRKNHAGKLGVTRPSARQLACHAPPSPARRPVGVGDPFLLHLFAALAERERRIIGERTRLALQAAKARGVKLGGSNKQSLANQAAALAFAKKLKPILTELADLSANAAAIELNARKIRTPAGGRWHAMTVTRVRERLL